MSDSIEKESEDSNISSMFNSSQVVLSKTGSPHQLRISQQHSTQHSRKYGNHKFTNKTKKTKFKTQKQELKLAMKIRPIINCFGSLKDIDIFQCSQVNYDCMKTSCFPFSKFQLTLDESKQKTYTLVSNIGGTKYSLMDEGIVKLLIVFESGCGICSGGRKCRMYVLQSLNQDINDEGVNRYLNLDLQKQFITQQIGQITEYKSKQPIYDKQSNHYCLPFSKQQIVPSKFNSIISNSQRQTVMQLYQITGKPLVYQINAAQCFAQQLCIAYALASLDFKWMLQ